MDPIAWPTPTRAGLLANLYAYDSYGRIEAAAETVAQPYAYTGREFDAESGLHYYRARYYDSQSGRFLAEDPIGFGAGDANLYRYVFNNPVNFRDPDGLIPAPVLVYLGQVGRGCLIGGTAGALAAPFGTTIVDGIDKIVDLAAKELRGGANPGGGLAADCAEARDRPQRPTGKENLTTKDLLLSAGVGAILGCAAGIKKVNAGVISTLALLSGAAFDAAEDIGVSLFETLALD